LLLLKRLSIFIGSKFNSKVLAFVSLFFYDSGLLFSEIRREIFELDPFENGESPFILWASQAHYSWRCF
jgi:hypothetical protein